MPGGTAVVALHYQNDVLHPDGRIRVGLGADDPGRQGVIEAAGRLLDGARRQGWPILHGRIAFRPDYADLARNMPIMRRTAEIAAVQEGGWGAEFFDALAPRASASEFVVTHKRISAFYGTELEYLLHLLGARRVIVAGVATHSTVESTVRDAADRGFEVAVAQDACAAADRAVHAASLESMRLIAKIGTVAALLQGGE
ncbi:MAG: cysteine hydrolase family protein [Comamonas sp.]